jgi:hypothetical protein
VSLDILLTLLNALWGLVLIGIGFEMVNNSPIPEKPWRKPIYRVLFAFFGLAVIVTTGIQAVRTENAQREAANAASKAKDQMHADQLANQSKLGYMQGTLDTISRFVSQYVAHPPASTSVKFDPLLAQAIMKMARSGYGQEGFGVGGFGGGPSGAPQPAPASAPPRSLHPAIFSVPPLLSSGEIIGKDFGASGEIYVHPRVKFSGRHGQYEYNAENLLGGLRDSNYFPIARVGGKVVKWTDTTIAVSGGAWGQILSQITDKAKSRNVAPPPESDIDVCYEIVVLDGPRSDCFPQD